MLAGQGTWHVEPFAKASTREGWPPHAGSAQNMKGLGQHTEKQHEAKTAGEYRQAAEEHTQTLKSFWKNFLVSGLFVVAAIVIILACLAWFMNNSRVNAAGVGVSAAGARYSIMADGDKKGVYDEAASKVDSELDTSDSMNISAVSNLNNHDGSGVLEPGSYGQLTFTVTPMAKDLNNVQINLERIPVARSGRSITEAAPLLSGHILFFEEEANGYYAKPLLSDSLIILKDAFKKDSSSTDTTEPVTKTLYWVWPERFRNYVLAGSVNYEKNLFATTGSDGYADLLNAVNDKNSSKFFLNQPSGTASADMSSSDLQAYSDAYDEADEAIGQAIQYVQVRLSAEEL